MMTKAMMVLAALAAAGAASAGTRTLPAGVTYLDEPIRLTADDTVLEGAADGSTVLSGGRLVEGLRFEAVGGGVFAADWQAPRVPDQLFIDGVAYVMARFPNRQPGEGRNVYDIWRLGEKSNGADNALDPTRVRGWGNPSTGYVHGMQELLWGDMHWRILGRDEAGNLTLEGGWQNNRPTGMHGVYRYVENIREELDAPGEWFYDADEGRLYVIPLDGTDLVKASVETVELANLVEIAGASPDSPVRHVTLRRITFRHAARTFMQTKERILRTDWALYRGAAVEVRNAADVTIEDCAFDQLGGNALIFDGFASGGCVKSCVFTEIGASGVLFLGRTDAVRDPLFDYGQTQEMTTVDRTPGPRSEDYPRDCLVEECLFHRTGRVEKQTAGVSIDIAARITVRNTTIAFTPRAGINIGDGAFGGHLIEGCDVFDTVLETGDHGAFNSWGRDRWWSASLEFDDQAMACWPELLTADMLERNTLRNNRWRCNSGWDIDLDDGSSFYTIEDNVCLAGGIKLREGFGRLVRGNYCANNGLHPHCWLKDSSDIVTNNIFFAAFAPVWHGPYRGKLTEPNVYVRAGEEAAYPIPDRVFGVRSPRLRKKAARLTGNGPAIPELNARLGADFTADEAERRTVGQAVWRRFNGPLEFSAFGVRADFEGWVLESGAEAPFADGDLLEGILPDAGPALPVTVIRRQQKLTLEK